MMNIKQVRPANGNDHHRTGSPLRIIVYVALATLISAISSRGESLSTPTKLSLSPLRAPTATETDPDHFSLAMEHRPRNYAATNGIPTGSSLAARRVLEAMTFLKTQRVAAKGSLAGLFRTRVGERGFSIAGIQAGYGMAFMDAVFTRGRNGTAMQEPCYIVVKTSLNF